jgi:hypothetical protein
MILYPTYIHIPDVTTTWKHEFLFQARRNNLRAARHPESEQDKNIMKKIIYEHLRLSL